MRTTTSRREKSIALLVSATGLVAILSANPARTANGEDALLSWNEIMVGSLVGQNPFAAGRLAAITQVAVFEAVNSITQEYESYAGGVPAPAGASAEAAAIAAAHAVLLHYLPAQATTLNAHRQTSLAEIADGTSKTDGLTVGESAAAMIIALRANDGAAPAQFHTPPSSAPGEWQITDGCPAAGGVLRHWGNVTTFGVENGAQFRAEPPPALDSGKYTQDFNELRTVGSSTSTARPVDRSNVADFYNIVLAVGTWNPVARQLATAQGTTLSENARAFALLNAAIHDALVTVMETKYHYRFWRPETAIPAAANDGNARTLEDPNYEPYIPTPCFPSYPSAHASAAYAAARVIQKIWGPTGHTITLTTPQFPAIVLNYGRIDEITSDIDDARVYGGIHFRFEQEAGAHQGHNIAAYLLDALMRPLRP